MITDKNILKCNIVIEMHILIVINPSIAELSLIINIRKQILKECGLSTASCWISHRMYHLETDIFLVGRVKLYILYGFLTQYRRI